ncbi:spore maturation protein [Eubacteriales bacterium OttesenSCG-928-M02]|nr:spore maturation protein [Eubacteriales bacterium OttesenSCG-928-M02]
MADGKGEAVVDISPYAILVFIGGIVLYGAGKRVDCYDAFTMGAKDGLGVCRKVLPYMAAMLVGVSMLRASGLLDVLVWALTPLARLLGLPPEALPICVVRPFSGSAALGVLAETLQTYGPDSTIARAACIIMGSSETLFYTASLYFGSVGIQQWRHTIPAGLVSSFVGMVMAGILC